MRKYLLAVLVLFISGCTTLQVNVDYDSDYNFKSFQKFSVVYVKDKSEKDFIKGRIAGILSKYIEKKGYRKVDKDSADFYFTVHLDIEKSTQVETNYETMGLTPHRYYPRGMGTIGSRPMNNINYNQDVRVTTDTYEYKEGKLIIEVFDVKNKEIVWQAVATDELSPGMTQQERTAYISKIVDAMFKDFPNRLK